MQQREDAFTLHCEHMPNCDSSSSMVGVEQHGQSGRDGKVTPSTPEASKGCLAAFPTSHKKHM